MRKGTVIAGVIILLIVFMAGIYLYNNKEKPGNEDPGISVQTPDNPNDVDDVEELEEENVDDNVGVLRGFVAPDFELQTVGGESIKLSDYRGKIVFLNFWTTWSNTCKEELPILVEQSQKYSQGQEIVILSVNVGAKAEDVKAFMGEDELMTDVMLDLKEHIASKYNIMSFPTTFIIDSDGVIYDIIMDKMDTSIMDEYVYSIKNFT